jgi:hypothetical protein
MEILIKYAILFIFSLPTLAATFFIAIDLISKD